VVIVIVIVAIIVAVVVIEKNKKEAEEEEEDEEEEETGDGDDNADGDGGDDNVDGYPMRTAAAQDLVDQIVSDQVPKEMDDFSDNEGTSSGAEELAPEAESSTGAAQLIESIIAAIDDVDPEVEGEAPDGESTEAGLAHDPQATTAATDALISEVLNDPDDDTNTNPVPEESATEDPSVTEDPTASSISVSETDTTGGGGGDAATPGPREGAF